MAKYFSREQLELEYTRCVTRINELTVIIDEIQKALDTSIGEDRTRRLYDMAFAEGAAFVADRRAEIERRERKVWGNVDTEANEASLTFDDLAQYTRELANLMGLRDWTVNLEQRPEDDEEDEESCASQFVPFGTQRVNVSISSKWPEWSEDDLRATIVHELIHCHTARMMWSVNIFAHQLSESEAIENLVRDGFLADQECAVESIATAWANALPTVSDVLREVAPS